MQSELRRKFIESNIPPAKELVETEFGTVEVREFTAAGFDQFLEIIEAAQDEDPAKRKRHRTVALIVVACHDPQTGAPVFTVEDVSALAAMPFSRISGLFRTAERMNRVQDAKKSSAVPASESSSDWPESTE